MEVLAVIPYYIIPIIAIVAGIYLNRKAAVLRKRGKKVNAVVVRNTAKTGAKTGVRYYPVVQFTTESNEQITQDLIVGYTLAKQEGSMIEILYDPQNPKAVEVNSNFQLFVLPKLIIGI